MVSPAGATTSGIRSGCTPAEQPVAPIEPRILMHHQVGEREPETETGETENDRDSHNIWHHGQQWLPKQSEGEEPVGGAKQDAVGQQLPPGAPGDRKSKRLNTSH